jgi:DNA-binding response OmpR family regulator
VSILLVEDEVRVADFVRRGLAAEGWSVEHVGDGESALELFEQGADFDVLVLDLMLPGISGLDVCRRLRARGRRLPILMLTALDAVEERVGGLKSGADDYLAKPFAFDELIARIEALYRRRRNFDADTVLRHGPIAVDPKAMTAWLDGVELDLSSKERAILVALLASPDAVLSRERLLNTVWGHQSDPLTNTVDVHVGRLRKKLGAAGDLIRTVRGIGYGLRRGAE